MGCVYWIGLAHRQQAHPAAGACNLKADHAYDDAGKEKEKAVDLRGLGWKESRKDRSREKVDREDRQKSAGEQAREVRCGKQVVVASGSSCSTATTVNR